MMISIQLRSPPSGPDEIALIERQKAMLDEIVAQLENGIPLSRHDAKLMAAIGRAFIEGMRPATAPVGRARKVSIEDLDDVLLALRALPRRAGREQEVKEHAERLHVSPEWLTKKLTERRKEWRPAAAELRKHLQVVEWPAREWLALLEAAANSD